MKEHQHVEWKEVWRDDLMRCLCGFANAEGGVLVVGRNDKGEAVGVADARKLLEDLPNKIRDVLGIMADVHLVKKSKQKLIEIRVEPYPTPISFKGSYYYRSGSTTQELKGAGLERFMNRKHGRTWDGAPWPGVSVRDLSKPAIDTFRKAARQSGRVEPAVLRESASGLIEKLHLTEGKYLKRAALLLFHDRPEHFFTSAYVKVGFFSANEKLLYHDEIHGDLFTQASKTVDTLRTKYLKAGIRFEGIQRVEAYPVPDAALREAVLNALIHKDYASGATIQISVYADRLMIWNPGYLPPSWTVAKLTGKHSSQPPNPGIANGFFRAGEIEAWGWGIERMLSACRDAGCPKPLFEYEHPGLWVTFPFAPEIVALTSEEGEKTVEKTPVETPGKRLGKTPARILELLRANPSLTVPEIAAELSKSESAAIRAIHRLQAAGRVRRVGSRKAGHWEVLE
jgi:ATP-dependent DNA helicase RecG